MSYFPFSSAYSGVIKGWLFQLKVANPKEVDPFNLCRRRTGLTYINSLKVYCRRKTTLSIASHDP